MIYLDSLYLTIVVHSTSVIKPSRTLFDPRGLGKAFRTNLTEDNLSCSLFVTK